jgi:hypothetical protein
MKITAPKAIGARQTDITSAQAPNSPMGAPDMSSPDANPTAEAANEQVNIPEEAQKVHTYLVGLMQSAQLIAEKNPQLGAAITKWVSDGVDIFSGKTQGQEETPEGANPEAGAEGTPTQEPPQTMAKKQPRPMPMGGSSRGIPLM